MRHSFLLGHLLVIRQFYRDWASDANFIQTFGYYMSLHWRKHFPNEVECPPVIYVDVWPIAVPMAFSMKAYVSNQIEIGSVLLPKSPMQGEFLRPISNGRDLNCMHGEEWRTWRARFNPGFSKRNIRAWVPAIHDEVEAFVDVLEKNAGQSGGWGSVFQLELVAGNLAFDVVGRVVVNQRFRSQSCNPTRFARLYREQLQHMEITLNPLKLLWRSTLMFRWLTGRKRNELFQLIQPFILASTETSGESRLTIVQAATRACKQEVAASPKIGVDICSKVFVEQVFYQLMIFFFGGEDAISIVVPYMFKHLEANPECITKLQAEHDEVFGADPLAAPGLIKQSPHLLDSLQYSAAVIKETLRLNPATITIREGQPDFAFDINGSSWPTHGFDLFDSSITIHRDPENFPRPMEFIPERFLVPEGHELHPPKNIWRGFQLGPRKCIGQEMAMAVLKMVLVMVVRRFEIKLAWDEYDALTGKTGMGKAVESERMYTTGKATSHPKDGAPVKVRFRTS